MISNWFALICFLVSPFAWASSGGLSLFENSQSFHEAKIPTLSDAEMSSIRTRTATEASVAKWVKSVEQLKARTDSALVKALKNPTSHESQIYAEYLRYLSHRGAQSKVVTETSRELGFSTFEATEVMDGIMTRFTALGESIPPETCKKLSHLIQGGAYRVDIKSNTFSLNHKLKELHEIQDAVLGDKPLTVQKLDEAMGQLIEMDGGSAFSIRAKKFGVAPSTSREIEPYQVHSLMTLEEKESLAHVTQELPELKNSLERMSKAIEGLSPKDPAFLPKVQFYRTYANHAIYNAEDVLRAHGAFDRISEAVVEVGDEAAARRFTEFITNGLDQAKVVFDGERHVRIPKKKIWYTLLQVGRSRDKWDAKSLNFMLDQIEKIASSDPAIQLEESEGRQWLREIEKFRLNEPIGTSALEQFMAGTEKSGRVKVGAMIYEVEKVSDAKGAETLQIKKIENMPGFSPIGSVGTEGDEARRAFDAFVAKAHQGPALWNPNLDMFREFLANPKADRQWVRIGSFEIYFRKQQSSQGLKVVLADINADKMGSKLYPSLLKTIEEELVGPGFKAFEIETVRDLRHQKFYEEKMGYKIRPGSNDAVRSYTKEILPAGTGANCTPLQGFVQAVKKLF